MTPVAKKISATTMRMVPPNSIILVGVFVALSGCGFAQAADAIVVRNLAKGAFSGITEPTQQVIHTLAAWEQVWTRHWVNRSPAAPVPEVNFDTEMVIVATMGRQRTGGYVIDIVRVAAEGGKLKVFIQRRSPPPGSMTIQVLTTPFHMVAVPRSALTPEFVDVKTEAPK
jgi:hypothetical protein